MEQGPTPDAPGKAEHRHPRSQANVETEISADNFVDRIRAALSGLGASVADQDAVNIVREAARLVPKPDSGGAGKRISTRRLAVGVLIAGNREDASSALATFASRLSKDVQHVPVVDEMAALYLPRSERQALIDLADEWFSKNATIVLQRAIRNGQLMGMDIVRSLVASPEGRLKNSWPEIGSLLSLLDSEQQLSSTATVERSRLERPEIDKNAADSLHDSRSPSQADTARQLDSDQAKKAHDQIVSQLTWRPAGLSRRLESEDLYALNIDEQALAVSTLLYQASGEFCFGLFGPWGSGKTTLSERIERLLTSREKYKATLTKAGIAAAAAGTIQYAVVRFSAWKYRRPPEIWVYLYEILRKQAFATNPVQAARRFVRTVVARTGHLRLIGLLAGALLLTAPLSTFIWFAFAVFGATVAVTLAYGINAFRSANNSLRKLLDRYATVASHRDKLGLLAVISDDLRSLLLGWIPAPHRNSTVATSLRQTATFRSSACTVCARVGWLSIPLLACVWLFALRLMPKLSASSLGCAKKSLDAALCSSLLAHVQANTWAPYATLLVWAVIASLVAYAALTTGSTTSRILLIVDDLDRCSPSELVDIIESLKLLLEDEEIESRLQMLVLADESILRHAIASKFGDLIARLPDTNGSGAERIIREHLEKLFICQFRLPLMSHEDVEELARLYAGESWLQFERSGRYRSAPTIATVEREDVDIFPINQGDPTPGAVPIYDTVSTEKSDERFAAEKRAASQAYEAAKRGYNEQERTRDEFRAVLAEALPQLARNERTDASASLLENSPLKFSALEVRALATSIRASFEKDDSLRATPRAIRAMLFRYELCRLLWTIAHNRLGNSDLPNPEDVIDALETARRHEVPTDDAPKTLLRRFAEQVA